MHHKKELPRGLWETWCKHDGFEVHNGIPVKCSKERLL